MKKAIVNGVSGFVLILWPLFSIAGTGANRVEMKGYYKEDGTFLGQRGLDPLAMGTDLPVLPANLRQRKKRIADYYTGRLAEAKITFPACRAGVRVDLDHPGQTNVDLYRQIDRYGTALEKDDKAVLTEFRVVKHGIDVDINGGGYGTAGDVTWRVVGDIFTLGLLELRDDTQLRKRRGSRLRIVFGDKGSSLFSVADINVEKFRSTLSANERPSDQLLNSFLPPPSDVSGAPTGSQIARALNRVQFMPNLDKTVEADKLRLSRWAMKNLAKAKKAELEKQRAENLKALLLATDPDQKLKLEKPDLPIWAKKKLIKKSKAKKMKNTPSPEPSFDGLSKKQRHKMLKRARRESLPSKPLPEKKTIKLNRDILQALYPSEIFRGRRVWTSENLNFETINASLSPALGLDSPVP